MRYARKSLHHGRHSGSPRSSCAAAERVTLRNGFEMRCDHHAQVEGRIRLYLSAGEDNYIEFAPQEIARFEIGSRSAAPHRPPTIADEAANYPTATRRIQNSTPPICTRCWPKPASEHNLDVDLLASLVKAESGGNAHAVSRAGARGLMQLMPGTATEMGVKDSFEPDAECARRHRLPG